MSTALKLIQEIEKLTPAERVRVIDRVIRDIIRPDAEIEKVWVREVEARWDVFERGQIEPVSYETVMSKYRE